MATATVSRGIELDYETAGDPSAPALLVVNGYTAQRISTAQGLIDRFVEQGLFVITFDNRDCGLSTKLEGQQVNPAAVLRAALADEELPAVPYTLSEMAADAVGLLDHLGIDQAHIVGSSMGGMIVQTIAIEHPARVASLTSIMSSPGDPRTGKPTPEARDALLAPPPAERQAFIEQSVTSEVWGSRRYFDADAVRALAAAAYDRSFYPQGATRQLAAIYASGDRSEELAALDVPTLVIHGRDDTLITPEGGERTAQLVPGARYLLVSDMGHDLPAPLWPMFAETIGGHARVAAQAD